MIIVNYSPDIKRGNNDRFALLFDMNETKPEVYHEGHKNGDENMTCQAICVNVVKSQKMNGNLGKELEQKMFKEKNFEK